MAEEKIKRDQEAAAEEYVEKVLEVRRVAKVITGGRRFSFSALVVVGDRKGRIGLSLGKSREASSAIAKAVRRAKDTMVSIPLYKTTIPFTVQCKHGSSKVIIRSAAKGTGVIAGGAVRAIMEALGVKDVLAKSLGSSNPQNVAKAALKALGQLKSAKDLAALRGKTVREIIGDANVSAQ